MNTSDNENSIEEETIQGSPIPDEVLEQLHKLSDDHAIDIDAVLGREEPLDDPDVDISLHPSREVPIAGELWSVTGNISNRSTKPIWISDTASTLTLSPEMYGQGSQTGSIGAFFPTTKSGARSDIARIDPGANYSVVWKIDPASSKGDPGATKGSLFRIKNAISNFSFFNPGKFKMSATVHVWSTKPKLDETTTVNNLGDSFAKSVSQSISMDSSPWVLILGAAIGGILCFIFRLFPRSCG